MAEILVVEDYPPVASMLTRMLRRQGHQVVRELTVAGALTHNRAFEHAVLDIDLPDGNGVALAVQLVHQHRVNSIVFFTATRDATDLAHAAQLGLVVHKSDGIDRLLQAVEQLERRSHFPAAESASLESGPRTLFGLGSSEAASLDVGHRLAAPRI